MSPALRHASLRLIFALVAVLLAGPASLAAQTVTGRLTSAGEAIANVQVIAGRLASPLAAAVSQRDGSFRITGLPRGEVTLTFRGLGYETVERVVDVPASGTVTLEVDLTAVTFEMNPIVVTGSLAEQRVKDSPVKVEVVSQRLLERNASRSLMDAVGRVNGLYQQVDCGVCYTNSIRVNGMEGPYTAILIDGMPIMGALASVYGLNGIDPRVVEQIEILKGPQSTLYGTEAMGGVINVITKDPRFAPRFGLDMNFSDLGQLNTQLMWAPNSENVSALVTGSLQHNDRFVDRNQDAFSDLTLDTRATLFGKAGIYRNGVERIGLSAKLYYEDRFGGLDEWTESDLGSSTVYGESIQTQRAEVMMRARTPWENVRFMGSYTWHDQESWYGDLFYGARQDIAFGQLVWDPAEGRNFDVMAGTSIRWDRYDDETPATPQDDTRFIPGVFAEGTWFPTEKLALLAGARVDRQDDHGTIFAPRATLKADVWENGTLRGSFGTGFRIVNLFTEDHAALTGARQVIIAEGLEPEESVSFAANFNQILEFGDRNMMIDVDVFRTEFSNRIIPDYDTNPNQIIYANLVGTSVSQGFSVSMNQNFGDTPFLYNLGFTVQDVFEEGDAGVREAVPFAADYTATWGAQYTFRSILGGLGVAYTGQMVGPMRLPEFTEPVPRPTRSERFTQHDVQLDLAVGDGREFYFGVENLGDFRQPSPLIDPANPFGDTFDTAYAYGPVVGRRVFAGVRLTRGR